MRRSKRGRPAVWNSTILSFVQDRGSVRAVEIRKALGISASSCYYALKSLISSGQLTWKRPQVGNYRTVQINKNNPLESLAFLAGLGL